MLKWQAGEGEIALSLGGRVLAKLAGQGLQSKQQLVDLMRGWDMHGIKAIAGI